MWLANPIIMLYLSQIIGGRVEDSADKKIGRLKDILVKPKAGSYAPLVFLLVQAHAGEFFVPYEFVENLSRGDISLKTLYSKLPVDAIPPADCLYLERDVMDQQIVDTDDARVVRVNDLKLGVFGSQMCVLGIDVSIKGIMRRLGVVWLDVFNLFKVNFIDWRNTHPVKGTLKLDTMSKNLMRLHPADLANIVEDLNLRKGSELVFSLEAKDAAKVMEELDPRLQKLLIHHLGPERAARIIDKMSVDELVDLMQMLPEREAQKFLSFLKNSNKLQKVETLLEYPDDSAGGLMTTDFIAARPSWTVEETIAEVKKQSPGLRSVLFVYVTDDSGKFLGPVSVRNLLIADRGEKLKGLIKPADELATLHPHNTLDEIMDLMTKYDLYTVAVLNEEKKLMGIVSIDDVMRELKPHA